MNNQQPNPFFFHNIKKSMTDRNLIPELPLNITSLGPSPFRQNELLVEQAPEKQPEQTNNLFDFWKEQEEPAKQTLPANFKNFQLPTVNDNINNEGFNSMNSIQSNFFPNKPQSQFSDMEKMIPQYPKFSKVGMGSTEQLSGFNFFPNNQNQSSSVLPDLGSTFNTYKNSILKPEIGVDLDKMKCNMTVSDINSNFDVYKANQPRSDFGSAFDSFKNKIQNLNKQSPKNEMDSQIWNMDFINEPVNKAFLQRGSMNLQDPFKKEEKPFSFLDNKMHTNTNIFAQQSQVMGFPPSISKRSFESFKNSVKPDVSLLYQKINEKFGFNPGVDVTQMVEAVKMQMKAKEKMNQYENDNKWQNQIIRKNQDFVHFNSKINSQQTSLKKKNEKKPKLFIEIDFGNPKFVSFDSSKEKKYILQNLMNFANKYSDSFQIMFNIKESFWVKKNSKMFSEKLHQNHHALSNHNSN
jgi:hypothetical protein